MKRESAHERKLRAARKYLADRGIAATAKDSTFVYDNHANTDIRRTITRAKNADAPLVIVPERVAR